MGVQPIFALVDGNSFYASCEVAFAPQLMRRPVVVLSNNDGCIVAANQIAKDLAESTHMMFQPYFKVKRMLDLHQAAVFSSNYELYGDMSNRMHSITRGFALRQEIYSIDESFLELTGLDECYDLSDYGQQIKARVFKYIGIPVAVGIAHTKTLAKLANHMAKQNPNFCGVLDLTRQDEATLHQWLSHIPVGKVWGVGKRLSRSLIEEGIETAWALRQSDPKGIRQRYNVVLERTVRELRGESCLALEVMQAKKKQILSSRSFGQPIEAYELMQQAVATYVNRAVQKLRQQGLVCHYITVFIRTNPFNEKVIQYHNSHCVPLICPSDNLILLTKLAKRALAQIWKPNLSYHKAGVLLQELQPKGSIQGDLFAQKAGYTNNPKQDSLMQVMDELNQRYGSGSVVLGAQGGQHSSWSMKRNRMSNRYTSRWDELLVVK